ncbi:response regulator [Rhodoferax sp.]|uniref:response regulator n=1 Tax=Rhodoferax sp. TaxID=50421 RepID=UPI00284B4F31|nr:response regulator [Rhodoferax sp.]MDR3368992.1 response regulator [Rhodoferax sp.]
MKKTFGTSLVIRTSGLILLSLLVFAFGSYRLIVQPTVNGLAQAEMGLVSQQLDARIQRLFESVEMTLRSSRGWGQNGDLDLRQLLRFNEFFFPVISNHTEISSVNFSNESGQEILLLHTAEGKWINRLSNPDVWGKRTYWLTWNADRVLEKSEMREIDYDTRKRPWFQGAMALSKDDAVYWTEPYIFFTTQEPGITASMRWTGKDGQRYVIGHDVKLLDLSRFTTRLRLGNQGIATLMTDNGALLALPHAAQLTNDRQLKAAALKQPSDIGLNGVAAGYANWLAQGRPLTGISVFEHDKASWFSLFRATTIGQRKVWLAVFAPKSEFIPVRPADVLLLLLITSLSLAVGSLVAVRVARRFAKPLEELARESERIGRMDLLTPVAQELLSAPWREVVQLSRAQESMRQRLLESSTSLAQANEQLEAKVQERTLTLAHQVALIEALLDIIPNPIFYKGADSRFIGCNQAYEVAFGINRQEFIGKRVSDLDYLPESARIAYQREDEAVIRDGSRVSRNESLVFADGQPHDTLYSVTGFRDADGSPGGLIGMIVDVSVLKAAERDAREARAQAEAASAAKAEFLANMSHEIRTPMNAVMGMTQLALQTDLTERQRSYLDKAHAAARGLLALINDILDFSKIEAGRLNVEHVAFKLESVVSHATDLASVSARDKGLELLLNIASDVPEDLIGDPLRLGQVLTNLVSNAVKFTDHGEITVCVSCTARQGTEARLFFEVRDTGIGMTQEAAGRVFEAFSQADSSTTRRYGGTGLGLSISKRIVELMEGDIGVSSQPEVGSNFHFTALFRLADAPASPTQAPRYRMDLHGMSILVVDDNAAAREVFVHMLTSLGFAAFAVAGGQAALVELERAAQMGKPYPLALIDWKMPDMDGVETLRRIHIESGERRLLCLLATAHDRDSLTLALGDTPVEGILDKPATASTLLDAIITACHRQPVRIAAVRLTDPRMELTGIKAALQGKRILLVEDNETNQELAVELLQNVGMTPDLATNGAEALDKLQHGNYALILMDCQMPVMDGLEATRLIRQDERFTPTIIVAMTANAMAGEREKCLLAGMNDYLAKPIDIQAFYATLMRWLAPDQVLPDHAVAAPSTVNGTAMKSDETRQPKILDKVTALRRMGGDQALYQHLQSRFCERETNAPQRLRLALEANDKEAARRVVHNLKGLAASIGADQLAAASLHLEYHLDGAQPVLQQALTHWENSLNDVLLLLGEARPQNADDALPAPQNMDRLALESLLHRLSAELHNDDAKASRSAAELLQLLAQHDTVELARSLARHAAQYDYDTAIPDLQSLAQQLNVVL